MIGPSNDPNPPMTTMKMTSADQSLTLNPNPEKFAALQKNQRATDGRSEHSNDIDDELGAVDIHAIDAGRQFVVADCR